MRRKVKRTLKVRTTETWTITWRSDGDVEQPPSKVGRRLRKALLEARRSAPPGEVAEGEGEHDPMTTQSHPIEKQ